MKHDSVPWCKWQIQVCDTKDGSFKDRFTCTANMAEGRLFDCPYENNKDRLEDEYPCSEYESLKVE